MRWLVDLLAGEVVSSATGSAKRLILGSEAESLLEESLSESVSVTVAQMVEVVDAREFAAAALREHLKAPVPEGTSAGSVLDEVRRWFQAGVEPIWTLDDASSLGLDCGLDEFVEYLVVNFVHSVGLRSSPVGPLAPLVALLQTQLSQSRSVGALRSEVGHQASQVVAWISIWTDPPEIRVMNPSDAPIFNVRPTPALVAYDDRGEVASMVGNSPLKLVRQIDPDSGYAWPMNHCSAWGSNESVASQLHLNFSDASGRAWLLAHDAVVEQSDPWGGSS